MCCVYYFNIYDFIFIIIFTYIRLNLDDGEGWIRVAPKEERVRASAKKGNAGVVRANAGGATLGWLCFFTSPTSGTSAERGTCARERRRGNAGVVMCFLLRPPRAPLPKGEARARAAASTSSHTLDFN